MALIDQAVPEKMFEYGERTDGQQRTDARGCLYNISSPCEHNNSDELK